MKYGFIKVAAATPQLRVADCRYNTQQIINKIDQAEQQQVKLLVLPELCVTGYTCADLFLQAALQHDVAHCLQQIAAHSHGLSMLIAVGAPLIHRHKRYNCAVIFYNGAILGVVPKAHLPNYMEFQEVRYFAPAPKQNDRINILGREYPFGVQLLFRAAEIPAFTVGFEICEDLWVMNPPSIAHAMAGASIIGNLSASNETIGKESYRRTLVVGQSARLLCGYIYASAGEGESTTDMVFSAHNLIAENGQILQESSLFQNEMMISEIDVELVQEERLRRNTVLADTEGYHVVTFDIPLQQTFLTRSVAHTPFIPGTPEDRELRCQQIIMMQAMGLKKRLQHIDATTVLIGLSGGLDSTLALLASVQTIDLLSRHRTDIVAVSMPCFGTTSRTRHNAQRLAEALGVTFREIAITESVRQHFADIGQDETVQDITYENAQARERTQVLMDLANQMQGLVVGTGDLSELALGFATYNGDHMSMYGLNASIPKTLVRHLIQYVADHESKQAIRQVLYDILDTPISPELLPHQGEQITQKTEEIIGPYELHDFFLYYVIRFGFSPKKIFYLAIYAFEKTYDRDTIVHWLRTFYRRFFSQQFKRSCMPDGVKVGSVTLSPRGDFRMPSDAAADTWLAQLQDL